MYAPGALKSFLANVEWRSPQGKSYSFVGYCVIWQQTEILDRDVVSHREYALRVDPEFDNPGTQWIGYVVPQAGPLTGAMPGNIAEQVAEAWLVSTERKDRIPVRLRHSGQVSPRASNKQFIITFEALVVPETAGWNDFDSDLTGLPDLLRSAKLRQQVRDQFRDGAHLLQEALEHDELTGIEKGVIAELVLPAIEDVIAALELDEDLITDWTVARRLREGATLLERARRIFARSAQTVRYALLISQLIEKFRDLLKGS